MEAGKLNRLITLQKRSITRDSIGNGVETWADHSTRWAEVITTGGSEFYAAQRLNAETTAVFKIRYTAAINTLMRIKFGSDLFDILNIADPDGKRVFLNVSAKGRGANG